MCHKSSNHFLQTKIYWIWAFLCSTNTVSYAILFSIILRSTLFVDVICNIWKFKWIYYIIIKKNWNKKRSSSILLQYEYLLQRYSSDFSFLCYGNVFRRNFHSRGKIKLAIFLQKWKLNSFRWKLFLVVHGRKWKLQSGSNKIRNILIKLFF